MKKQFCDNLKTARLNKGFSQSFVAEQINVARSTYSLYENGKREPNIDKIKKLASLLDVTASELLGVPNFEISKIEILARNYKDYYFDDESLKIIGAMLDKLKKEKE